MHQKFERVRPSAFMRAGTILRCVAACGQRRLHAPGDATDHPFASDKALRTETYFTLKLPKGTDPVSESVAALGVPEGVAHAVLEAERIAQREDLPRGDAREHATCHMRLPSSKTQGGRELS